MKKRKNITVLCVLILFLAANPAFSQTESLEDLQDAVNVFSAEMAKSLPFNSTLGLNWSDAYIGQLIGVPPHFGIGASVGFTTIKMDFMNNLMNHFDYEIPLDLSIGFPLPAYTIEARIGGFVLPFDIGVKFGYLNTSNMSMFDSFGVNIDYMLFGADIRYALIDSKLIPVKLSVGAGFNHLKGGISAQLGLGDQSFSFDDGQGSSYSLSIRDPELGLLWQTNTLELKAHVSFPLFIITPYLGVGASYSWAKAGYKVKSDVKAYKNSTPVDLNEVNDTLNEYGLSGVSAEGFESIVEISGWNMRVYGGLSFNLAVIRLDFTVMYNFRDSAFGGSFGIRFQL